MASLAELNDMLGYMLGYEVTDISASEIGTGLMEARERAILNALEAVSPHLTVTDTTTTKETQA